IYTYESIMQEAGIILNELEMEKKSAPAKKERSKAKTNLSQYSNEELEKMLDESLDEENYILAAKIRDELKKRSGDQD
ncbi:MAG: hypothetical protein M3Q97_11310, partial [Bacteroidota bacterium]|nr:hypothetical protein [Bacteroidota bacterium]